MCGGFGGRGLGCLLFKFNSALDGIRALLYYARVGINNLKGNFTRQLNIVAIG